VTARRRICVFTGSRADYGPLSALLRRLRDDPAVDLLLLVSGAHLVPEQGMTVDDIVADGFPVAARVEMVQAGDSPVSVAKSLGTAVIGYADALDRLAPDVLVVLGDRYEALGAALAALPRLLPVAHVAGGHVTAGSTDDATRHAITKLSHLHFTATPEFRRRVIQLGEDPARVFAVGSLGLDTVLATTALSRQDLAAALGVPLTPPVFAVTYHPATAEPGCGVDGLRGILGALDRFPDATKVFTVSNVDVGGREANALIADYARQHPEHTSIHASLGRQRYLSLLRHADLVLGNSSSGLIEAPAVHTPTVNVGTRQAGRPRAPSVVDAGVSSAEVGEAICRALSSAHREVAAAHGSPYGDGHAAGRVAELLTSVSLAGVAQKSFRDLIG
jgi:UDP-hydrolysing UDP-N-acetyl-D-glucosamine 2-epimerase